MPHSYADLIYHIIFSTKDREPMITSEYQERLYEYISGIIRAQGR
jgi:putative transposase